MNDSLHTYKSIDKVSSPPENKKYLAIQKARREIDPHLNKENYNKGSIEHDETTDIQDEISDLLSLINERDFKNSHGYTSNILIKFALEFGSRQLAQKAISAYFQVEFNRTNWMWAESTLMKNRDISKQMEEVTILSSEYVTEYSLPTTWKPLPSLINAAMVISKEGYDLAIPVLGSGAHLGNFVEMAGINTKYIEYHRDSPNTPPKWIPIGRNAKVEKVPENVERIILIEDDIRSGGTIEALMPEIDRLNPSQIDLILSDDFHPNKSKDRAKKMGYFSKVRLIGELNYDEIFKNLSEFRKQVESALFKK